ncbi:hypothetical protein cce_0533 [Crocosphaera subtropica ATCC 51142]|uniref:Uncharacterized protein n=1 Tax=Crocosphaera subtropica (strain ATCC 51142 / BH68) TaxID=43989 RepID=B1WPA2_CROS5|nr:hypothetical protein cce_0533 [Crocosphaera subtropica ATCC 51142]
MAASTAILAGLLLEELGEGLLYFQAEQDLIN